MSVKWSYALKSFIDEVISLTLAITNVLFLGMVVFMVNFDVVVSIQESLC